MRSAVGIVVVAVLVSGAVTTAACSCRTDTELSDEASPDATAMADATATGSTASGGEEGEANGDGADASSGYLDDEELEDLEAQLEAMESELGALALPDNDFGDIEALLD